MVRMDEKEKTILVTGFEPFGDQLKNASWEAVKRLPDVISSHPVIKCLLPVEFGRAAAIALEEVWRTRAAFVFLIGEAGGRDVVTPETTARNNRKDLADNAGYVPEKGEKILRDGPDMLHTKVNVKKVVEQMKELPVAASDDAGSYVCNDLFYLALSALDKTDVLVDFVHVPYSDGQNEREVRGADGIPEKKVLDIPVLSSEQAAVILKRYIELAVKI